jgi:hypothetical protein
MDHSSQNLESNQIIVHNTTSFFIKATSVKVFELFGSRGSFILKVLVGVIFCFLW